MAVLGLFVAAVLSKTVTCTLPAVLLLIEWWRRGTPSRRTLLRLAPLFVIGLGMAAVTVWMERHRVGAEGDEWTQTLLERVLIAGRILWFYPRTLLWPDTLTFIYPRWTVDTHAWWQYLPPAAFVAAVAALHAARGRLGQGPLVAVLCYAAMLAPALGFINVYPMRYAFVADHFAYLPITALMVLGVAGGTAVLDHAVPAAPRVRWAVCVPLLLMLAFLTTRQCAIYHDLRTLWTDTVAKNPDCWLAHNNLGVLLLHEGDIDAAAAHFTRALHAQPGYREALINLANTHRAHGQRDAALRLYAEAVERYPESTSAHTALAIALAETGKPEDALTHLQRALQLDPTNADAHTTLGWLLHRRGQLDAAASEYAAALALRPDAPEAHYTLARILAAQGRTADAVARYTEAVRLKPAWAEAQYDLGTLLLTQGRLDEATAHFVAALDARPDYAEAHSNLGYLLFQQGHAPEAIAEYRQALRIKPDYPEARTNLGVALAAEGQIAEAIAEYEAALRVKPDHAAAHRHLGIALARQGQTERAIVELQTALRLSPDDREARARLAQLEGGR